MNLTKRMKISLAQLLDELDKANLKVLFDKYGMNSYFTNVEDIKNYYIFSIFTSIKIYYKIYN